MLIFIQWNVSLNCNDLSEQSWLWRGGACVSTANIKRYSGVNSAMGTEDVFKAEKDSLYRLLNNVFFIIPCLFFSSYFNDIFCCFHSFFQRFERIKTVKHSAYVALKVFLGTNILTWSSFFDEMEVKMSDGATICNLLMKTSSLPPGAWGRGDQSESEDVLQGVTETAETLRGNRSVLFLIVKRDALKSSCSASWVLSCSWRTKFLHVTLRLSRTSRLFKSV